MKLENCYGRTPAYQPNSDKKCGVMSIPKKLNVNGTTTRIFKSHQLQAYLCSSRACDACLIWVPKIIGGSSPSSLNPTFRRIYDVWTAPFRCHFPTKTTKIYNRSLNLKKQTNNVEGKILVTFTDQSDWFYFDASGGSGVMFPDPSVVLYACVSTGNPTTILADFNPGNDPNIEASAVQRLQNTPPYHSTFSHTNDNRTYTYLIAGDNADSQVVFFGIFDNIQEAEQGIPLLFLNRLKERFDSIAAKRKNRPECLKTYRGLQSAADELFLEPLGLQSSAASGSRSKGVKNVCERFLGLAMCVVDANKKMKKKKKKAAAPAAKEQSSFGSSNEHSDCALVADLKQET